MFNEELFKLLLNSSYVNPLYKNHIKLRIISLGSIMKYNSDFNNNKKKSIHEEILGVIESALVTWFVVMMIVTYLVHPVNVIGISMQPTLNPDDKVLMLAVMFDISYGDIVIINNDIAYLIDEQGLVKEEPPAPSLNECIVKRVIACGGQTINIDFDNGKVYIDGVVKDEPFIEDVISGRMKNPKDEAFKEYPLTIPEGYYFVMGDNRNNSSDSRHKSVGLIKKEQICGKAVVRYSPFLDFKIF